MRYTLPVACFPLPSSTPDTPQLGTEIARPQCSIPSVTPMFHPLLFFHITTAVPTDRLPDAIANRPPIQQAIAPTVPAIGGGSTVELQTFDGTAIATLSHDSGINAIAIIERYRHFASIADPAR